MALSLPQSDDMSKLTSSLVWDANFWYQLVDFEAYKRCGG